jgi:hypothetical protein
MSEINVSINPFVIESSAKDFISLTKSINFIIAIESYKMSALLYNLLFILFLMPGYKTMNQVQFTLPILPCNTLKS